ncbi:hypothetical protein KR038_009102, partial [Drosophila bunnanda]
TWTFFQMVLAIVLRIIIPFSMGSNALSQCNKCTAAVVTYYIFLSKILLILTTLFLLSISVADLIGDWISVGYIPLLLYVIRWTFLALFKQLQNVENSYYDFMTELKHHWWDFFNNNNTYWPNFEKKLQCCGLEGPRSYMEYLRKVPGHCYNPQLITLGCWQIMHDLFEPMPRIGYYMCIITLAMEVGFLIFYGFIVFKKLISLVARWYHKKVVS